MSEELNEVENEEAIAQEAEVDQVADEEEQEEEEGAIQEAFDVAINDEDEQEEDDIKLAMIGAGATFKNVTRLYNKMMVAAGLAISKEDKAAFVAETLEGLEFVDEEGYDAAVALLMDPEKKINERSAGALLRAFAKKGDLDIYKKPKVEGSGRVGFASGYYDWLIGHPRCTEKEANAYIMNSGNSDNVHKHESHYMNIWKFGNGLVAVVDKAAGVA